MPFVQISLIKGKSEETITEISDSVHQALVDVFHIPELDKFQVVHELESGRLIYPPSYLDVPHSHDLIFIHITAKEGRTVAMKTRLYEQIATTIAEKTKISSDDVFIVLSENKAENWSFGRGLAQLVK